MKHLLILLALAGAGQLVWFLGSRLSPDALGMAIGLVFGVLAGVPSALMVLAANRRPSEVGYDDEPAPAAPTVTNNYHLYLPGAAQPVRPAQFPGHRPAALIAPASAAAPTTVDGIAYPARPALPGPGARFVQRDRVFKVVGEKEEWIDEW